eukprot:7707230-Pyramimonas_sp.AAC.1
MSTSMSSSWPHGSSGVSRCVLCKHGSGVRSARALGSSTWPTAASSSPLLIWPPRAPSAAT